MILQSELKQIGIDMQIQALDSTTQFERQQKKQFAMAYLYETEDNLDPKARMLYCCVSNGGASSQYSSWKDLRADALYEGSVTATDVTGRAAILDQWQKIVMANGPFIWLINPSNHFAYRANVHNFSVQNTAHWPLSVVWKS